MGALVRMKPRPHEEMKVGKKIYKKKASKKEMTPADLNTVARLALIAKNHGPHFLDNADSFDRMLGRGRFAELNSDTISHVRRLVEALDNCRAEQRIPRQFGQ